jgi:hypothetical protein
MIIMNIIIIFKIKVIITINLPIIIIINIIILVIQIAVVNLIYSVLRIINFNFTILLKIIGYFILINN